MAEQHSQNPEEGVLKRYARFLYHIPSLSLNSIRKNKWLKRTIATAAIGGLLSTGLYLDNYFIAKKRGCDNIKNPKTRETCYKLNKRWGGANYLNHFVDMVLFEEAAERDFKQTRKTFRLGEPTLEDMMTTSATVLQKESKIGLPASVPQSYESSEDLPKETREAKPKAKEQKLPPVTGFVKQPVKGAAKKEIIPTPGYVSKSNPLTEHGMSLQMDGTKLYYWADSQTVEFANQNGSSLEALIFPAKDSGLELLRVDLQECNKSAYAFIDMGENAAKYENGRAAIALKEKDVKGENKGTILASSPFNKNIKDVNGILQRVIDGKYECVTEEDKEQLAKIIPAPENQAPQMFPNMSVIKGVIGEPFEGEVGAFDPEDEARVVIGATESNKKYVFGAERIKTQIVNEGKPTRYIVTEHSIKSQNPIKEKFTVRACAIDQDHDEKVSFAKQCLDYTSTDPDEEGKFRMVSKPVEEQGPVVAAEAPLEWAEETREAEKKLGQAAEVQAQTAPGEFDLSLEGKVAAAEVPEAEAPQAPAEVTPADDSYTLSIKPKSPLKDRLFHRKQVKAQQAYTLDPSRDHPNGLRRLDPLPDNKKYIIHTDSKVRSLNYTTYLEDGTSVSKQLRVNGRGNAKLKQKRIPNNAVVLGLQDTVSNDELVLGTGKDIPAFYLLDENDKLVDPVEIKDNGNAKYQVEGPGKFTMKKSAEKKLHDQYDISAVINDKEQKLTEDSLSFTLNPGDNLQFKVDMHTRLDHDEIEINVLGGKKETPAEAETKMKEKSSDAKSEVAPAKTEVKPAEQDKEKVEIKKQEVKPAEKQIEEKKPEVAERKSRVNLGLELGARNSYYRVEAPTWSSKATGESAFIIGNGSYDAARDKKLTLGSLLMYEQGTQTLEGMGDAETSKINIGVYGNSELGKGKVKLHLGYNRIFDTSNLNILNTDIKQTKTTDRVITNVQLGSGNAGRLDRIGINLGGYLDSFNLKQDRPDVDESGVNYRAWIGPFAEWDKLFVEAYLKHSNVYSVLLERGINGKSVGAFAAYNGGRFGSYANAEVPASGDLRIADFNGGLSFKPLKKKNLHLNLFGGHKIEIYTEGDNDNIGQDTYFGAGISTQGLSRVLHQHHIRDALLH